MFLRCSRNHYNFLSQILLLISRLLLFIANSKWQMRLVKVTSVKIALELIKPFLRLAYCDWRSAHKHTDKKSKKYCFAYNNVNKVPQNSCTFHVQTAASCIFIIICRIVKTKYFEKIKLYS